MKQKELTSHEFGTYIILKRYPKLYGFEYVKQVMYSFLGLNIFITQKFLSIIRA